LKAELTSLEEHKGNEIDQLKFKLEKSKEETKRQQDQHDKERTILTDKFNQVRP